MAARRAGFWIKYLVITACVTVLLLDGAVRALGLAPSLPEQYSKHVTDAYLPWKFEPLSVVEGKGREFAYSYRHNSMGFRDVERSLAKPVGTVRILALGDSFTYGAGAPFEQTYPSRVEQILNEHYRGNPAVEVIKAGVGRFWPEPERLLLEHYGLAYDPDLVLVAFLPNDVLDTYIGVTGIEVNEGFLTTRGLEPFGGAGTWLYIRSRLFRLLFLHYLTQRLEQESARPLAPKGEEVYCANGLHEKDWQRVEHEYERMAELTRAHGAQFAVVFIPQASPWPPTSRPYPQQRLATWAKRRGVPFIDTAPALAAASLTAPMYYPEDGHCTPAGYDVIARTVAAALLELRGANR